MNLHDIPRVAESFVGVGCGSRVLFQELIHLSLALIMAITITITIILLLLLLLFALRSAVGETLNAPNPSPEHQTLSPKPLSPEP